MNKSWYVHYKNKYPGGKVVASESSMDVYCAKGEHRVSLQKGGDGQWHDKSEELGCLDRHDLAPIPKDSRVHKMIDGKLGKDEEHEHREKARELFMKDGKVQSCAELGLKHFDEKQRLVGEMAEQAKAALK